MTDATVPSFPYRNVTITGGTGTVAAQLQRALLRDCTGVERIATTVRDPAAPRAQRLVASPKLDVFTGGIQDVAVVRNAIERGEIVYHLAAWLANTAMPDDPNVVYLANGLASAVVCRLCRQLGKTLVYTSSHSVYFAGPYEGRIAEDTFAFRDDFTDWIENARHEYYRLADIALERGGKLEDLASELDAVHEKLPPPFEPLIYDREEYHIYCLTKLLGERFALDHGGVVLRLANVYGPGDDSTQAVGEACARVTDAAGSERLTIRQPFKKLVPAYLGDICASLVAAASVSLPDGTSPIFTVASQEDYLKEDELLRTVATALNNLRGETRAYDIERLEPDEQKAFTYDTTKLSKVLLPGHELMPLAKGLEEQLRWLDGGAEERWSLEAGVSLCSPLPLREGVGGRGGRYPPP